MALQELDNSNIAVHLGSISKYKSSYDPSLLVREPRQSNRTHLGLQDDDLPFVGGDTWNAYEVSGLTNSGLPVAGVGKIYYPCDGKYIVESKSIKLYFNSFNMTKLGDNSAEVRKEIARRASIDLSKLLEVNVEVKIFSNKEVLDAEVTPRQEWDHRDTEFITIEEEYPVEDIEFSVYQETPELLEVVENPLDGVVYTHWLYNKGKVSREVLNWTKKIYNELIESYDVIFITDPADVPLVDDGERSIDVDFRKEILDLFDDYKYDLIIESKADNVYTVSGTVSERMTFIKKVLDKKEIDIII